jgi:hypothetical protein
MLRVLLTISFAIDYVGNSKDICFILKLYFMPIQCYCRHVEAISLTECMLQIMTPVKRKVFVCTLT